MSVLNWIGYASDVSTFIPGKFAKSFHAWAEHEFCGSFVVNIGDSVEAHYGARYLHTFGHDSRLLFSGSVSKSGGLFKGFATSRTNLGAIAYGLNGVSDFCYGGRTEVTYGGPQSVIRRGPSMTKVSDTPLESLVGAISAMPTYIVGSDPDSIAYNARKRAEAGARDVDGEDMASTDVYTVQIISLLSSLLYLVTAGSELAVRFGYPNYPKTDSTGGIILAHIDTILVPRIQALIYAIEKAGSWDNWLQATKQWAADWAQWLSEMPTYQKVLIGIAIVATIGGVIALIVEASEGNL